MAREVHGVLARAGTDFENPTGLRQSGTELVEDRLLVAFTGFGECEHRRILGLPDWLGQIPWLQPWRHA